MVPFGVIECICRGLFDKKVGGMKWNSVVYRF